jgi:exodeoxyribonuclease V
LKLTEDQKKAIDSTTKWYKSSNRKPVWSIAGYSGTGKTTVIKYIAESLGLSIEDISYMTPTGKATLNLRKKGIPSNTIHSTIYRIVEEYNSETKQKTIKWRKVYNIESKLFIIDEISMVSDEVMQDVLFYNIPVIVVGDPAQLPPVGGICTYLENPDVMLTEIHRQALESGIIRLSMEIRNGNFDFQLGEYSSDVYITDRKFGPKKMLEYDIVLCGTNNQRENLNKLMRNHLGYMDDKLFYDGEKIICRMNNKNASIKYDDMDAILCNGMIAYIQGDYDPAKKFVTRIYDKFEKRENLIDSYNLNFKPDFVTDGTQYQNIRTCIDTLKADDARFQIVRGTGPTLNYFLRGYAISCHSSQGSEWDRVILFDSFGWNRDTHSKFLYTGVTRAKNKVVLVV